MPFMSGMARDGLYFKAMPSIGVFDEMHLSIAVRFRGPQDEIQKTTVRCGYVTQMPTRSMSGMLL